MSEVNYELKHPFSYAYKGDMQEANFITLVAPNYKQLSNFTPIKQAFMAAIQEVSTDADKAETPAGDQSAIDESGVIPASQCIKLMYALKGDVSKVFVSAAELFRSGVATIDGESKLTQPIIDKIHLDDFEGLVGAYIANFIAKSLLDSE